MAEEIPQNQSNTHQVYKEEEFTLMCEFIAAGLWRTTNLSRACNVERETIERWKKMPDAQKAYRKAVKDILAKRKIKGDPEKMMKELNMEVDADEVNVRLIEVKGLEEL